MELLQDFYTQLDHCYSSGGCEDVERFLLQSLEQEKSAGGDALIAVYNELGGFYRGISCFGESLDAFEQARLLTEKQLGRSCEQYATILNNMAGTYRLMREYEKAIDCFLEAIKVYKEVGTESSYAYTSVLNNLSLAYQETKHYDLAIIYLQEALHRMEETPENHQELAVTLNNLTALYHAVGELEKALCCLQRALNEYDAVPEAERVHYAAVLNSLAGFLYDMGDCERALALYRRSAKYTLKFFGENAELAATCLNMRWVCERLGRRSDAVAILEKAAEIYERLFGESNERTLAARADLARLREETAE